ncbi:YjgN family protein [Pelagicoccus sp. SDUM812002]|uniref:YjgN family protein n=1 Tax=Pelagicoccus sp. SDUM812002 TaxID=3041266 RepID=UPI00280DFB90|nr:YjgN family protein [Pelagicoccus sp. SDUM812002]MDQ8186308.1 YjgN family protein [Pelagicoccus sp. SDUM812002]
MNESPAFPGGEPPASPDVAIPNTNYPFSFTGQTGEYFRIWIVNMLLTLVTVGFYTPWARVRTRRYFHANTHLDGHAFDYLAKPINILWGYLIVLFIVGGYYAAGLFNPVFTVPFFLIYVFVGPWVVYKAMRFKAHNTSYRNVRFQFHGTVGDAYVIYLGIAILIPITFGLIIPYWIMKQKEYFYKNLSFGGRKFEFTPQAGEYYIAYIVAAVIVAGIYGVMLVGFMATAFAGASTGSLEGSDAPEALIAGIFIALYIPLMLGMVFVQIYVYVTLFNYNLGRLLVQQTAFSSTLKVGKFYWITLTNILATVFSFGLLAPWAAIRKTRYLAESVELTHPETGFGDFVVEAGKDQSSIGDAAADMFEIDIGW